MSIIDIIHNLEGVNQERAWRVFSFAKNGKDSLHALECAGDIHNYDFYQLIIYKLEELVSLNNRCTICAERQRNGEMGYSNQHQQGRVGMEI